MQPGDEITVAKVVVGWVITVLGFAFATGRVKATMDAKIEANAESIARLDKKITDRGVEVDEHFATIHGEVKEMVAELMSILVGENKDLRFVQKEDMPRVQAQCKSLLEEKIIRLSESVQDIREQAKTTNEKLDKVVLVVQSFRTRDAQARTRRDD